MAKPSKGTSADQRLKANKAAPAKTPVKPAAASGAKPAFGSAAWDAKYGIKKKLKG